MLVKGATGTKVLIQCGAVKTHWGRDEMDAISQTTCSSWIPIEVSLKFVPRGSFNNNPALFQIMAWRRPGDKPLTEPVLVSSLTHICVTRPQWVNTRSFFSQICPKDTHSSPVRARHGVSFVDSACDGHAAAVRAIIYVISYNIEPRYNGTRLYMSKVQYVPCPTHVPYETCVNNVIAFDGGLIRWIDVSLEQLYCYR